jgi:hypothetical protein
MGMQQIKDLSERFTEWCIRAAIVKGCSLADGKSRGWMLQNECASPAVVIRISRIDLDRNDLVFVNVGNRLKKLVSNGGYEFRWSIIVPNFYFGK